MKLCKINVSASITKLCYCDTLPKSDVLGHAEFTVTSSPKLNHLKLEDIKSILLSLPNFIVLVFCFSLYISLSHIT